MTRRGWLAGALGASALSECARAQPPHKKIAAIVTEYRYNSHADVLCGRLLAGYSPNNVWEPPRNHLVSLYVAQFPANDMSRDLAPRFGFGMYPDIAKALTLGGDKLAVDGVVFIGEHGDYPSNELGQKLYPRFEMFSQILDVYERSGRSVPTFFDKHFSYSWEKADAMYRRAKKLGVPLMAGSSIPFTVRKPALDPPLGTPITGAVAIGYADLDAYGFHTLEALQCLVERRKGGETGIASVEWIDAPAVAAWRESERGAWSKPLFEAAVRLQPDPEKDRAIINAVFVLNYTDGLKAAAYMLREGGWSVALRVQGNPEPLVTNMSAPTVRPLPNWDGFVRCVDLFLSTGQTLAPPERTLLTTGALALCFESKRAGKRVETPQLNIRYKALPKSWFETA